MSKAGVIVPTEAPLPLGLHELPFLALVVVLWVGAMIRANGTYWIGRLAVQGGRRTRLRRHLDSAAVRRAERFMARWGPFAVPLCFLTIGIQTAVNATAGATRMPLRRYLPAVSLGALLWALVYATVGLAAFFGALRLAATSPWALAAAALAIAAIAVTVVVRRRRRGAAAPSRERDDTHA